MQRSQPPKMKSRRHFLRLSGLVIVGSMGVLNDTLVSSAVAGTLSQNLPKVASTLTNERQLSLVNIHTGEKLSSVYFSNGSFQASAVEDISQLLRDHRTGDIHPMDPAVLDFLSAIANRLEVDPEFHVISGFRSAQTNTALQKAGRNVARKSFHLLGQAVDVRMPGVEVDRLHQTALALQLGGVGLYRGQDFIHIDTGPVRRW